MILDWDMGQALFYQRLNMQELTECQKTINYCKGLVEVDKFNNFLNNEKNFKKNERFKPQNLSSIYT